MREFITLVLLISIPFINWRKSYNWIWKRIRLLIPDSLDQVDVLLRKKWPTVQASHLFLLSFILICMFSFLFLLGNLLKFPTIPIGLGVSIGLITPFLGVFILRPSIESSFLFEVRNIYTVLRTQVIAGARPIDALDLVHDTADILKRDIAEIQLAWGNEINPTLDKIATKYATDELNILLSLIQEMYHAGTTNQQEVMASFDRMKEMLEDEIRDKEKANDDKEMTYLEISSFAYIGSMVFLMILPVTGDIVSRLNNLNIGN